MIVGVLVFRRENCFHSKIDFHTAQNPSNYARLSVIDLKNQTQVQHQLPSVQTYGNNMAPLAFNPVTKTFVTAAFSYLDSNVPLSWATLDPCTGQVNKKNSIICIFCIDFFFKNVKTYWHTVTDYFVGNKKNQFQNDLARNHQIIN